MKKIALVLTMFCFQGFTIGQNLISNPGFETGTIPDNQDQVSRATGWTRDCGRSWVESTQSTNPGTPDLFDTRTTNCEYDIPSNKWGNALTERTGQNRYVGFTGGYVVTNGGQTGPFYAETVQGTLTEALSQSSCTYSISLWAAARRGTKLVCGTLNNNTPGTYNNIEVVLRKASQACAGGLVVWTSADVTSFSWTPFSGTFTLTPAQAAVGYDRIEFRLSARPTQATESGLSHSVHLDDVSLTKVMAGSGHSSDFTLNATNPTGSTTHYIVTATAPALPVDAGFLWQVVEVSVANNLPIQGTLMDNPSNWWHASQQPTTTFPGYCCNPAPITGNGSFLLGHKYKVTRGVWGPCHPYSGTSKYVLMEGSGMVLLEDETEALYQKSAPQFNSEYELALYPSPAQSEVVVVWNGPAAEGIVLRNIHGAHVRKFNGTSVNTPLDISDLPGGVYLMTVEYTTGSETRRLVVAR